MLNIFKKKEAQLDPPTLWEAEKIIIVQNHLKMIGQWCEKMKYGDFMYENKKYARKQLDAAIEALQRVKQLVEDETK